MTPTLLATIAPTLGEISMLSSQRPLLALLLSLGGPTISVSRILNYDDPLHALKPIPTFFSYDVRQLGSLKAGAISIMQYLIAAATIANVVQTSWQLGLRTILPWHCNTSYVPFLWTTLSAGIHIIAATTWHFSPVMRSVRRKSITEERVRRENIVKRCINWFSDEFPISGRTRRRGYLQTLTSLQEEKPSESPYDSPTVFLNEVTGFLVFLHFAGGVIILSSLQFISVVDAITVIARFVASGAVSRIILMHELAGLRKTENAHLMDS